MRGTLLPTLNSGRLELPDHPKLVAQLLGLERRVARGGRESIDHGPHGHDELCNVVRARDAEKRAGDSRLRLHQPPHGDLARAGGARDD